VDVGEGVGVCVGASIDTAGINRMPQANAITAITTISESIPNTMNTLLFFTDPCLLYNN
jgi:hypothetical protein